MEFLYVQYGCYIHVLTRFKIPESSIKQNTKYMYLLDWNKKNDCSYLELLKKFDNKHKESVMIQNLYLSLVTRNPVFGVSDQVRLKPACSATESS